MNNRPTQPETKPQTVVLCLRDAGDPQSFDARVRRLVKASGRAHKLRLMWIREATEEERR